MAKLTKEQLEEIQEYINTLPEEEKEPKLKEIMSQFEQGSAQCPFCLMSEGKIQTTKVYDDPYFMAVLEINPVNPGHLILFPKRHVKDFPSMNEEETEPIAKIMKKLESALISISKSSNIIISDGQDSGNRFDHLAINFIPRQQKDNVVINWKGNKAEESELKKMQQKILQSIPEEKKQEPPTPPEVFKEKMRKKYTP